MVPVLAEWNASLYRTPEDAAVKELEKVSTELPGARFPSSLTVELPSEGPTTKTFMSPDVIAPEARRKDLLPVIGVGDAAVITMELEPPVASSGTELLSVARA